MKNVRDPKFINSKMLGTNHFDHWNFIMCVLSHKFFVDRSRMSKKTQRKERFPFSGQKDAL